MVHAIVKAQDNAISNVFVRDLGLTDYLLEWISVLECVRNHAIAKVLINVTESVHAKDMEILMDHVTVKELENVISCVLAKVLE